MLLFKAAALQELKHTYKLSSQLVDAFEKSLRKYNDQPEDYEPRKIKKRVRRSTRSSKSYTGKTPRTNLTPKSPFGHVFDLHDEYSRSNTHDFGVFGEFPFR